MSRLQHERKASNAAAALPASDEVEEEEEQEDVELNEESDFEDDKSETEQELERLVFGDSAGFREGLQDFRLEDDKGEEVGAQNELDGLDDAELFFTDTAGDGETGLVVPGDKQLVADDAFQSRHAPAWEDSDDERISVSLATVSRLRKLRIAEGEDIVSGTEYSKRLRRQFELVNPRPQWAVKAMQAPARKKRRTSDDATEADRAKEAEFEEEELSAAPLSKLLQDAESLVSQSGRGAGKKRKLRPEVIDIQRARDIGEKQPSIITSLTFHPKYPLLLSSGPSSTLYLHHIAPSPPAPTPNPLLTSMHIRGNPLQTTEFNPSDDRIFLSSSRQHFFSWNLNSGRVEKVSPFSGQAYEQRSMQHFKISPDGNHIAFLGTARKAGGVINVLSAKSLQWVSQARVESRNGIADFAWWRDSRGISIAAKSGEISEWSLEKQRVVAKWHDEGAVGTTVIGLGGHHSHGSSPIGTDRWIAVGSSSGIVNIYDRQSWLASASSTADEQPIPTNPTPAKTFDHLTTPTSNLTFSPDGQVLAMSSRWKRDALKLVHLPSCTVFRNWPTSSSPLGRVSSVAFAEGSMVGGDLHSLMAVGNDQGAIRLWEIR